MILNGSTMTSGSLNMNSRTASLVRCNLLRPIFNLFTPRASLPSYRVSCRLDPNFKLFSPRGSLAGNLSLSFPAVSTSPTIPWKTIRKTKFTPPKASKDIPFSFRFPPMNKKPGFWWRILACISYLTPLHLTWLCAKTAYNLHPFLEDFEFMTHPFLVVMHTLPSWFSMAYFVIGYVLIVKRKEWPHFFRFHLILGMLLKISLQVFAYVTRCMPQSYTYGKVGMHFWAVVAFAFLFTVLECVRCALCGMYADVPCVSDAAYIQISNE